MSNEITALPKAITPAVVYQTKGGVDDVIAKIKAEVSTLDPDVSTEAGRQLIRSTAYKVARSKTLLDDMGKRLIEDARKTVDSVNADRRRLRDELDKLGAEVRRPLTEFEYAEQRRIEEHENALRHIIILSEDLLPSTSLELEGRYQQLQAFCPDRDWQEFAKRAADARELATSRLLTLYKAALAREEAEAEAEQQREEAEEQARIAREHAAREREERLKAEAASAARQKAEAEALARERAAKRAWEEREARIRAAAAKAEQDKRAAEEARAKAEQDAIAKAEALEEAKKTAEEWRRKSEAQWAEAERRSAEAEQKADQERRDAAARHVEEGTSKQAQTAANKLRVQEAAIVALTENGLSRSAAAHAIGLIAMGRIQGVAMQYEIRELAR
jgi:colicin import membrane protein